MLTELLKPEDRAAFVVADPSAANDSLSVEARARFANGSYRWLAFHKTPLVDPDGSLVGVVAVGFDVHDNKVRQEGLEFAIQSSRAMNDTLDVEQTLQAAWKFVPALGDWISIYLYELDGSIRRFCSSDGDDAGNWTKIDSVNSYLPDYGAGLETLMFSVNRPDDIWDADPRIDADLKLHLRSFNFHLLINVPLVVRDTRIGNLVVMRLLPLRAEEETGRRARLFGFRLASALGNAELYREAQERSDEWERVSEAKSEFLGLVSHELRNPLTVIYGGLESLVARDDLSPDEQRDVLLATQKETRRLRYLVEDLLALSRIETKGRSQLEPILLQRQVKSVLNEFPDRWRQNVFLFADEGLAPVWGEPTYVGQIVRNLVDNADKYSPRHLPVEILVKREDSRTVVTVADHGPGVAEAELEHIFERFYRSSGSSSGRAGLGLGLTVCQRLVEAQGGSIWAQERPEGGLIVSFTLEDVEV
jgi:signal transduction histidine kinase